VKVITKNGVTDFVDFHRGGDSDKLFFQGYYVGCGVKVNSESPVWHHPCADEMFDRKVDVLIGFVPVVGNASVVMGLGVGHREHPVKVSVDFTLPYFPVSLH